MPPKAAAKRAPEPEPGLTRVSSSENGEGLAEAGAFFRRLDVDAPEAASAVAASPRGENAAKVSPMMAQYCEIKAANPGSLLFYRMGDFYELFFADAEIAAKALGIVLTKRGKHQGDDIPMCGVPVERAQDYLHRLIGLGHRVAVCEQIEDPAEAKKRGAKSVVRREVRRLVTPGTLTEEPLLDPARANRLLALAAMPGPDGALRYGLAALDISTGEFCVAECAEGGLEAGIARFEPAEIVYPETLADLPLVRRLLREAKTPATPLGRGGEDAQASARRIRDFFSLATLDGLGALTQAEIAAAAAALLYIERTQFAARPALGFPARISPERHMAIDAATRANLELTRTLAGEREGSLLSAIDRSVTAAGGRLLAERLAAPLTDPAEIGRRQDAVAFFLDEPALREKVRRALKAAPDPARALSRLALERGGPRDLACLRDALFAALALTDMFGAARELPAELAQAAAAAGAPGPALPQRLKAALAESLPSTRRDGGFVARGHDRELDELRALRDETREIVAALQARYCERADMRQLKLRHNNFLGYYLEAPRAQGERLLKPPFDAIFIHRQTMADAMRFSTAELAELEAKISGAAEAAAAREQALFDALAALILADSGPIKAAAAALAQIDVAAGLAEAAADGGWTRPEVDLSLAFAIEGGRHPVVEAALRRAGEPFVANDCRLCGEAGAGGGGRIAIVTGPNMAGKSTYLRQNALITAMAQLGSFVPARRAHIGVVDRLYSRVGASDDLARGRSTFMVEMVETAAILNGARERSLVILDEIGRGTATFDGLSIAWAAIEHLHEANRSRTLFATHFHELTQLARRLGRIDNLTVRVREWKGDVVFLHEIVEGAADRSYGVQVAKLAGLPASVVARAKALLSEFEAADRLTPSDRLLADLPLFSAHFMREEERSPTPSAAALGALGAALDALDPDGLCPRDALDALYRLKRLRSGGTSM